MAAPGRGAGVFRRVVLGLLLVPVGVCASTALAQDSHYWTEQYGNRARIMGGAVIGSSSDLSSVYYNPGRLALVDQPEFLLAGNVFEYSSITLEQESIPQKISSSRFSLSPSLFAGEFRFGWLGKSRLAYSFLTRNFSEINTQGRLGASDFVIPALGQADVLTDTVRANSRLSEYWAGITWSREMWSNIGVGVSTFMAVRNQRGLLQRTTQAVFDDSGPAVSQTTGEYSYDHWRLLWKLGVGTDIEDWDVGLTVTTPGLKVFGGGRVAGDRSRLGVPGEDPSLYFADFDGLSSTYNSPWSVAVGGSRVFDKTRVHVGIEWFSSVSQYDVLKVDPVLPVFGDDDPVDLTVGNASDSVINIAVAVAHQFNDRIEGYGSIRTDFSHATDVESSNLSFTAWNLYHVAGGLTFEAGRNEFTTGAVVAFGSSAGSPRFAVDDVSSSYFRVTGILGFSFGFADNPAPQ